MLNFVKEPKGAIKELIDCLRKRTANNLTFDYQQVVKTNDTYLDALVVQEEHNPIGKTIYLDGLLKEHSEGATIENIANRILDICKKKEEIEAMDSNQIFKQMQDWEYLMDGHITFKLINRENSKQYLNGKTFIPFLDLAVLFCMTVDGISHGIGTVAIPAEVSKSWGISLEDAFKQALTVVQKMFPLKRRTLKDLMFELVRKATGEEAAEEIFSLLRAMDTDMIVQSNTDMLNGATTLLYKDSFSQLCKELDTDALFIIPSSLHELLLLRKVDIEGSALKMMVEDVNRTHVAADEILSSNIYVYDDNTQQISIWEEE